MATRVRIRRRRQAIPVSGPLSDRAFTARVPKHRSSGRGRLPKQRGAPAKNLHRIDNDDLDEFLELETIEIQRMLRRRKRNLNENGTKVELWLRLKESDRVEALAGRRRAEAELAEVATEAAIRSDHAGTMNTDKDSAGAADMSGSVVLQEAYIEAQRQAHQESRSNITRDTAMACIEQEVRITA